MDKIRKKINSFINTSIGTSLAFILLGILFLVFPETSLDLIRWIIAVLFIGVGAYLIVSDFTRRGMIPFFSTSLIGVILLVIGFIFAVQPDVMNIFPIVLGALFIIAAVSSSRFTTVLRGTTAGTYAIIATVLSIICGVLLIANPWGGNISMMMFVGIMMIIYAMSSLVDMVVLKKNIKELSKQFKKYIKE